MGLSSMRRAALGLLATTLGGCALGFGAPVPGLDRRHREYVDYWGLAHSNDSGGGEHGFTIGSRVGKANATVGSTAVSGFGYQFNADYTYAPTETLGFSLGGAITLGQLNLQGGVLTRATLPVEARVLYRVSFFVFEGGGGLAKGSASWQPDGAKDAVASATGWSPDAFIGASAWIPFPGMALGLGGRIRRDFGGDVNLGSGPAVPFRATEYLANLNLTF